VALFVSCGSASQALGGQEGKTDPIGRTSRNYLEEEAAKYNLQPIALSLFGGVYNYNKEPWWAGKFVEAGRQKIEAASFKETKPGVYDTRDWSAIRS